MGLRRRPQDDQLAVDGVRSAEGAFRRPLRAALSRKRLKKVEETPLPMNNPAYFHKIIVHDIKDEVIPDDKHSMLFFETKRFSVERSAVRKAFKTQDRLLQRVYQPVRRISLPSLRIYIFGNTQKIGTRQFEIPDIIFFAHRPDVPEAHQTHRRGCIACRRRLTGFPPLSA